MIPALQGASEVVDMQRGFIKAPQMELAFKGIAKRVFQYTFVMMPKSEEEAEMVKGIVQEFKVHMLPSKTISESVRRLNIPNTFDIEYYYNGSLNQNLHRISECVLESMNVSYGGDRYKAYEGGKPVVTNLTLNFKELDLITREKAEQDSSMYFDNNFPTIVYDSAGDGTFKDVKNLLRRVALNTKVRTNTLIYDTYDVKEGETPESIADKLYDDPELHWVIMIINDITDRYHQCQ